MSLFSTIEYPFDTFGRFDSRFGAFYTRDRFKTNNGIAIPVPNGQEVGEKAYKWAAPGDVNAFFGLMLDNIAGLVLAVSMLTGIFGFPVDFALRYMVPGTAIGVLVGDILFFWMAFRYARQTGKDNVTAMPLGLDTPSTIGVVLFVIGPAFLAAKAALTEAGTAGESLEFEAAMQAWHIGICSLFIMGMIKLVMSFGSKWIQDVFPRAGLLGSLAAIALCLITFTQMPKIGVNPIVGFASLVIVLVTLIGRKKLPLQIPGALGAVLIGCVIWYIMKALDSSMGTQMAPAESGGLDELIWFPTEWLQAFTFEWFGAMGQAMGYLPYIAPFAIATVIGGIDCAESAKSVGDDFNTNTVIGVEAVATILAAFCGGVIQTTPYIGHPAYKAMGGRAAYTLATALFIAGAGVIGYFSLVLQWIPEAAVLPILIFIGIEITAQSFHATPKRHYAAIAVACIPAMAKLIMIYVGQFISDPSSLPPHLQGLFLQLSVFAGGFIMTSLIWAAATAKIVDRRYYTASVYFALGGMLVLFGIMHSPLAGDKMFLPWDLSNPEIFDADSKRVVLQFAIAYLVMAVLMFIMGILIGGKPIDSDEEFENLVE